MNHDQYKKWLQLLMYDELTTDEHTLLDKHLRECNECRVELEELKQFHATLLRVGPVAPGEDLLREARQELRRAIHSEHNWSPLQSILSGLFNNFVFLNYKIALGGVAMLLAGVLIGRTVFSPTQRTTALEFPPIEKASTFLDGETRIANVRFINSDVSGGQIEFTFDAVSQVHMKGDINEERVQKVLTHAMINDQNPGVRLRSVSAFSTQLQKLKLPDKEVKAALILAIKTDANPGVRKEALKALQSFPFDDEIKQAFLHVLMRDDNASLRIAAINSLDSMRVQGQGTDTDLLEVLKQRMHSDENNYVRIRAKEAIEEAKLQ